MRSNGAPCLAGCDKTWVSEVVSRATLRMLSHSVIALMTVPTPAFAQDMRDADASPSLAAETAEEIIVTAQRRRERLQDVPIAMTAIGHDELSQRGATDLSDLAGAVPGLSITGFTGGNASNFVSIRGVAGQVLPIGSGHPAALYIDGVYLSRPDAAFFGLDDVERIEVLRGPQGTLYGRNATAGAINIVTRSPDASFKGGGELAYGRFDSFSGRGSLQAPLGAGFSAGISGSYNYHDGYIRNTVTGNQMNSRDAYTVRGKLRYESSDSRFDAVLAGDYTHDEATPIFKNAFLSSGVFVGIRDPEEFASDPASEAQTLRETVNRGVALTLSYQLHDALELVSVTSWREFGSATIYDADASELPALITGADNRSDTFSQEIRSVFSGRRVRATAGANLFTERASYGLSTSPPTTTPSFKHLFDTSDLIAWALFSQMEFDLVEQLTAVAGLRYNIELRDFTIDYRNAAVPGSLHVGRISDEVLIPSLSVVYRMDPEVLFYAKASRGYQAPGFNFAPGATATAVNTFDAETLWAYEIGAKTQLFDRRITFNAAAFYYDYTNIQIRSTVGLGLSRVDNAAAAVLQGVEASLSANLPRGFSIGSQATYLHARYRQFCQAVSAGEPQSTDALCGPGLADRSGNRLNLAPTWSGGINIRYATQVGQAGRLSANTTYDFSSGVFYVGAANEPELSSGSWGVFGARLGFQVTNGPEFFVYGRNLTDDRFRTFTARVAPTSIFEVVNDPRTFGVGIGYRF